MSRHLCLDSKLYTDRAAAIEAQEKMIADGIYSKILIRYIDTDPQSYDYP